jgi:hypothetical protein
LGPIDNKTGKHFLDSTGIEDKAGALLRSDPLGSAGFRFLEGFYSVPTIVGPIKKMTELRKRVSIVAK